MLVKWDDKSDIPKDVLRGPDSSGGKSSVLGQRPEETDMRLKILQPPTA